MEYHWIEDIKEFQTLSKKWDEILITSGNGNPFLLSDFILTWWSYYSEGKALRILAIFKDQALIGGIPLYLKQEGWKRGYLRSLYYIGDSAANYTEPLVCASSLEDFWPVFVQALDNKQDWDRLHLLNVRKNNILLQKNDHCFLNSKVSVRCIQDHMNWAIDLSQGLEAYQAHVSKKLKKDLKQRRKRAIRSYGEIVLQEVHEPAEVKRTFDLYVRFSRQSFLNRNRQSTFNDESHTRFFKDFLMVMNQRQRLTTHVLWIGEAIVSINFGYRFGKGLNCVLTGFNDEYSSLRPGYLLNEEIIKKAVSEGETTYNWYGHYRFYKNQVCNLVEPLYRIKIFRKNIYNTSLNWAEETLRSYATQKHN